jgi:hypothetical protein
MRYVVESPAARRLGWILDGLNGNPGWGADASDVLAPEFALLVPPNMLAGRIRRWPEQARVPA